MSNKVRNIKNQRLAPLESAQMRYPFFALVLLFMWFCFCPEAALALDVPKPDDEQAQEEKPKENKEKEAEAETADKKTEESEKAEAKKEEKPEKPPKAGKKKPDDEKRDTPPASDDEDTLPEVEKEEEEEDDGKRLKLDEEDLETLKKQEEEKKRQEEEAKRREEEKKKAKYQQTMPESDTEQTESDKRLPITPEDYRLTRQEVDQAVSRFASEVDGFTNEVAKMVREQYNRRQQAIDDKYLKRIDELEDTQMQIVDRAIVRFQVFLEKYPNESRFTPDVMFRLGDFLFKKQEYLFNKNKGEILEEYTNQLALFTEGKIDMPPEKPHPNFSPALRIFNDLTKRFPNYRYIDAVYYLMAYCYQEMEDLSKVRYAFSQLIAKRPKSNYVPEAYLRIGNTYYEDQIYDKALQAFEKASQFKDSFFYDQILYKLASVYHVIEDYDKANLTFAKLNDFSEELKKETGEHSKFRTESIQFIAISYAQDKKYWQGAGVENMKRFFARIGTKPWESETFRVLGDLYKRQTLYKKAIAAYEYALEHDKFNPQNPELQNSIVEIALLGMRDEKRAIQEQQKLIANYGEESEWEKANQDNPEALKTARELILKSLSGWATYQHQQARRYAEMGNERLSKQFYKQAADAYRNFLKLYPHSKQAYELNYLLADALFYSGDYVKAAKEYKQVRDSKSSNKHFEDAAYQLVLCYYNLAGTSGIELTPNEEKAARQQRERLKGNIQKKEIPEAKQKYLDAADFYVKNSEKQAMEMDVVAWNTAEIFFEYNHLTQARKRYVDLVNNFPKSPYAVRAAKRIVESYTVVENWVKVTEWSEKVAALDDIGDAGERKKMKAELKEIKGSAMGFIARDLEERGEYEKAAETYLKAIAQKPNGSNAPKMLYNAAADFSQANRPMKAMELYQRLVNEYPDAEYAAESLFLVAKNARNSFNLDHASKSYARLYTNYPGIDPKTKCAAIFNHAKLKEFDHAYRTAARIYLKYSRECEGIESDAPQTMFFAGRLYEKANDWRRMIRTYEDYVERFRNKKDYQPYVIQAYFKIGETYEKRKNEKRAEQFYQKALAFYDSHPSLAANPVARHLAAQAHYQIIKDELEDYRRIRIGGRSDEKLLESFEKQREAMQETIRLFNQLKQYKDPEYVIAADVIGAEAVIHHADAWFDAPVPREVRRKGDLAVDIYKQKLSLQADPYYETAAKTLIGAFEFGKNVKLFASPWMKRALKNMNHNNIRRFVDDSHKMRKPEKIRYVKVMLSPMSLDTGRKHERVKPEPETEPEAVEREEAEQAEEAATAPAPPPETEQPSGRQPEAEEAIQSPPPPPSPAAPPAPVSSEEEEETPAAPPAPEEEEEEETPPAPEATQEPAPAPSDDLPPPPPMDF